MFHQSVPGDLGGEPGEETDWNFLLLDKMFSLQLKERLFTAIVENNSLDLVKHNIAKPVCSAKPECSPALTSVTSGH